MVKFKVICQNHLKSKSLIVKKQGQARRKGLSKNYICLKVSDGNLPGQQVHET